MPVKADGIRVLGLDNECESLDVASERPEGCIGEERATHSATLKTLIDGKTANQRGRQ